ncbi:MAG: hypothetical protein RID09_15770 [Coleofasciculus sp. G1-WW12-02]|uniref:hypothetical protein n=1 Tax=unclassified Coleofasciculus TaxID=2692782 RepID=UPI00330228CE
MSFVKFTDHTLDFLGSLLTAKPKVDLDLLKFEFLLSAAQDFLQQDLSSTKEYPLNFKGDIVFPGKLRTKAVLSAKLIKKQTSFGIFLVPCI